MKVLVTGATGKLGVVLTRGLQADNHLIRVVSRQEKPESTSFEWTQADLIEETDLGKAVTGINAIFHLASDSKSPYVDPKVTGNLLKAAREAKIEHFVFISIVGIDEIPLEYYRAKLEAEKLIENSGVPYSILRATQFHSLVDSMLSGFSRFPLFMPVPTGFRFQSVSEEEVANELLKLLSAGPQGRVSDFGGPEVCKLGDMAATWLRYRKLKKKLIHLPLPGNLANSFKQGKNTLSQGKKGRSTWQEWLETASKRQP